jgi:AbrB family looped-hinge helix DNA binding protein
MQITSKGQITIPQEVRNKLGLLPHTEVEVRIVGDHAQIIKAKPRAKYSPRAQAMIDALKGTARGGMTTDEIILMMRGEPATLPKRKRK